MFMSITDFQKLVTVSIWMFNNLLLNKSHGNNAVIVQIKLLSISQIFWDKLTMENYGYEPKSSQSLTS